MTTATQSAAIQAAPTSIAGAMLALQEKCLPLEQVTRPNLKTEEAAHYLNRRPQTLRVWAMKDGTGPLRPVRVNGRLAWPVSEIKRVLGVAA